MLEQGEILNLSNSKEYVVVSSVNYEGENYVYQDDVLKEVEDPELFKTLITKFNADLKEHLTDIISANQ